VPAEHGAGGCLRPKGVLRTAGKPPRQVVTADVLAFMTAQRAGGRSRLQVAGEDAGGVSVRTLRRRLSSVSELYSFLQARGDVAANPVPRACRRGGSGSGRVRVCRWCG
jgi:site-specific recombinase XerD